MLDIVFIKWHSKKMEGRSTMIIYSVENKKKLYFSVDDIYFFTPCRDKITESVHSFKYATFSKASSFEYILYSTCPIRRGISSGLNTYILRIYIKRKNINDFQRKWALNVRTYFLRGKNANTANKVTKQILQMYESGPVLNCLG